MPAWKNREAGRRGRDQHAGYRDDEFARTEHPRHRIERLTQTATAMGHGGAGRGHADEPDEDLTAVADELDRLLSERGDRGVASADKIRRRASQRRGSVNDVMGALDRLDRQVQDIADDEDVDDAYEDPSWRQRRSGDPGDDLDPGYGTGGYDREDDDPIAAMAPRRRREPTSRRGEDASVHMYKDLGRRIDALRKPHEQAMNQVREELGSLRNALGGLSRGTNETVGRQNAELRRLADMIERLRADKKGDQLARDVRKEVTELKEMVASTNVEGALHTLELGYSHILQRLDELSRTAVDPRVLRGVTARLNEIEDAFAALPRSEHMLVLEDRVVSIAERMEELLQRRDHTEIEPLRAELQDVRSFVEQIDIKGLVEGIDDRMKFVSGRLDDIEVLAREQRGLDTRLSAMEERMLEPETVARLQGRLEDIVGLMAEERAAVPDQSHLTVVDRRLDDIVDRLERMEHAVPAQTDTGAFEALEYRLDQINSKIDSIEKEAGRRAKKAEAAAAKAAAASAAEADGVDKELLAQLQERLGDLTRRLEQPQDTVTATDLERLRQEIGDMRASVAAPASTEVLEQRIFDLAQTISKSDGKLDDVRLEQLGEKVAALADQIENTSRHSQDFDHVTAALERIEKGLHQTRDDVVDIAREAAREAVKSQPASRNPQYDDAINALQGDLKRLLDAAEGNDERTRNTFEGVKSVLGSLSDRLESLERAETPGAKPFAPFSVEGPVLTPGGHAGRNRQRDDEDEARRPKERVRDRKADFIAAARRAAQAASAEAAQLELSRDDQVEAEPADEERGKARKSWLRSVLRRDRKADATEQETLEEVVVEADVAPDQNEPQVLPGDRPAPEEPSASTGGGRRRAILYTAAAVVLVIGALQVFKFATLPTSPDRQVAASDTQPAAKAPVIAEVPAAPVPAAADKETPKELAAMPERGPEISATPTPASVAATSQPAAPVTQEAGRQTAVEASSVPTSPSSERSAPPEVAFAPPAGVSNSFGQAPDAAPGAFTQSGAGATQGSLMANLPPEGIGSIALRSAAAAGNAAAEFLVGVKFTEGDGVPADLAKAASWYQKAADQGLAPAQYRLASLYEKGRGVDKDVAKAKAWYIKAAEAGNAKAMHNLAVLFAEGAGGEPNYADAAKWFESAANFGVKDSLFNLGILYAGGIGVKKDPVASYKWFAIAADQGDPEAAKRRDDVANLMDQETLAEARLAVETFKLKTPVEDANKVQTDPEWSEGRAEPAKKASVTVPNPAVIDMIREAQTRLNNLGFDTGTPDGQMGPKTRSAIRAFQRSLGLAETGEIDSFLMDELKGQSI